MFTALTIAGSDPSGGAGIQGDLKTFHAHGVYGMAVVTALTAQNTRGVTGVHDVPAPFVARQLEAVLKDLPVGAAKTGMLSVADTIDAVASVLARQRVPFLVVDPVMVATSGDALLRDDAVQVLVERLFRLATLVTPNRKEAEQALGRKLPRLEDVQQAAQELLELAELESAVITLGAEGIYYASRQGLTGHVPARARAVFDVTGAGDTVIAQLGLYVAAGVELGTAVFLANQAAALVVARLGTHAVDRSELRAALEERHAHEGKVLRTSDELERQLAAWRKEGRRIAFTNGVFDVLHVGHVSYLRFAKSYGDVLIVGVNDDASVKRLKGPTRPVNPLADRMEVLAALEMVDAVCSFSEDTPKAIVERVSPNVLVKGADWAEKGVVGREWVEAHGGQVVLAPLVAGKSTTGILERAKKNG